MDEFHNFNNLCYFCLHLDISTLSGSADETDYLINLGLPVQFAPGQNSATVALEIINDNTMEEVEQFVVSVSSVPNDEFYGSTTVSITDDDGKDLIQNIIIIKKINQLINN